MALQQKQIIDKIEVVENGIIQVRQRNDIYDDTNPSVIVSSSYHRWSLSPGDDLTGQDPRVQAIAQAAWTTEIIENYQANLAAGRDTQTIPS